MLKKAILGIFSLSLIFTNACGTDTNNIDGGFGNFNLKTLVVTKISSNNKISISTSLKWNTVSNSAYYELSRVKDGGSEVSIGTAKIDRSVDNFNDTSLEENSTYKYVIRAIDTNNKLIKKEETKEIKPINSSDLKIAKIKGLQPQPATNTVSRETNLSWESTPDVDLYYPSIENDSNDKKIFGIFTKDTKFNINDDKSPISPEEIIKQELPILTGGLEKAVRHRFSVYTIKFNSPDAEKATAIGIRESEVFYIII